MELRDCPFCCGHEIQPMFRKTASGVHHHWVTCLDCGASGPPDFSEAEAVAMWNCRPFDTRYTVTDVGKAALDGGEG